ncbi:XLF-domain-containing protein [Xylaria cf. heliscus]|nr:XLF-domain-containing protein [Xylaria cf. heliscus]
MESPCTCTWYPLPTFPELPALLVSACFGQSSYTLCVTDLANIWTEKLDRRGILLRSLQENTTIDLVDADAEQWAVFLSKLKAAVDPTSSDHHLTSISIAGGNHSNNQDDLTLHLVCELPKPLSALRWPVHLVKCQPASLTSELVLPLLQGHYVQRREAADLVNRLKEKDALIKKLLGKLSTMHTPLELIFNSLSAKHATTRAAAEERIKGLAPFDEERWRLQQSIENPQDAPSLLRSVFSDSGFSYTTALDLGVSDTLNGWWAKLGSDFRVSSKLESSTNRQEPKAQTSNDHISSGNVDDEDFEVQVMPIHSSPPSPTSVKSTGSKVAHEATESDESDDSDNHPTGSRNALHARIGTLGNLKMPPQDHSTGQSSQTIHTDGDDTASESEDERQHTPSKHTKPSKARLGTIGISKHMPQPTKQATEKEANDETASGSDSSGNGPLSPQISSTKAPTTPRKGTLGRIGGKSKDTTSSPQTPKKSTPSPRDDSAPLRKAEVRKIGAIGSKPHAESKRAHSNTPVEPEESETDEQKAERKRAELSMELNQKNVHPTRKKRKF